MERKSAIHALQAQVKKQLETAQNAFKASRSTVTSDESKQEGKYDTRGLEESYLAHGLSQKINDFEEIEVFLESCLMAEPSTEVVLGSLVQGRLNNESVAYLLAPKGGGLEALVSEVEVTVVTPESPLGSQLLTLKAGQTTSTPAVYITSVS